jgi:CheY-like chemotaxis protein
MSGYRVLHVDDEPDIREIVALALGLDSDLSTRSCASGHEALATAATWSPDIILLDVMMPAMDGPSTLKRLRENVETADIPVVFMTARAQSRELERFRSLGAVGVIPKPFDPMTLAASVVAHLDSPQSRLDAMRREFRLRVERDLVRLADLWSALDDSPVAAKTICGIRNVAHGLAGAGGIFGFKDISNAAAQLEESAILDCNGSINFNEARSALDHLMACANQDGSWTGSGQVHK